MVFVGNILHTVPYMLKHSNLFDELPESHHDRPLLVLCYYAGTTRWIPARRDG